MTFPDLVVDFAPGAGPFDLISYLSVDGTGIACSLTDSAGSSPTGSFEAIAQVRATAWDGVGDQVVVAKWTETGNQRTFSCGINNDGGLFTILSEDGTAELRFDSLEATGYAAGEERWLRWTFNNLANEALNYVVAFYESLDGVAWKRLGDSYEEEAAFDIFDSTSLTTIGADGDGNSEFEGRIYTVRLGSGGVNDFDLDATTYAHPDFRGLAAGVTSFADEAGVTWLVGSAGDVVELTSWVDISDHVLTAAWSDGKDELHEAFPPGEATITLKNDDRRFDPDNTSGPYFGTLDPRTPFRIRSTTDSGATYEDHFYGFVESGFEQTYGHPEVGTCTVRLTDLLGVISGYALPSVLDREIMRDRPFAYWPLDDEAGSVTARDASGNGFHGTYRNDPPLTTVEEGIAFNAPARRFDGINQAVDMPNEVRIEVGDSHSTFCVFRTSASIPAGDYATIFNAGGDSHQTDVLRFNIAESEGLYYSLVGQGGGIQRVSDETGWNDGASHVWHNLILVTVDVSTSNNGFRTLMNADGADLAVSATDQGTNAATAVVIGGHPQPLNTQDYFEGDISHVALFDDCLSYPRRDVQQAAATAPMAGSRSDEQIAWVLDYIGVPETLRDLDEGRALMGAADTKGKDALEFIRQVVETEGGGFYVNHADGGKLRFVERYTHWEAARSTTSQATFSDDASVTTAVRVEPDSLVVRANGIESVVNQVSVTWRGGTESAEDAASIRRWGPRGREVNAQAGTPAQARGLAQWLLTLSTEPHTEVVGLGVNAGAAQDAFPVIRDLRINDLITYRSQPQSTGSVTTRSLLVLGSSHAVEQGVSWRVDYRVAASPTERGLSLFTLDTSELDGPDVLGF